MQKSKSLATKFSYVAPAGHHASPSNGNANAAKLVAYGAIATIIAPTNKQCSCFPDGRSDG